MKKAIIVIAVIIVVGGLFWWLQQKTGVATQSENVPTRNWKTLQSEIDGVKFEFQHPADWDVQNNGGISVSIDIPSGEDRPLLSSLGTIGINVKNNEDVAVLLQKGRESLADPWLYGLGVKKEVPERTISRNGNTITFLGPLSSPVSVHEGIYIVISSGNNTAVLTGIIFGGPDLLNTINLMIETFKFTE